MELLGDQPDGFDYVVDQLENGLDCRLSGVAGTGKTVLTRHIIQHLEEREYRVVVTAPTHKAASLLEGITLDSALGLRMVPDYDEGNRIPQPEGEVKAGDILVIDECSMVGPMRWKFVTERWEGLKLCVGDPAQLPPVNNDGERSPTFELDGYTLETVLRQAKDNPIIRLAHEVREHGSLTPRTEVEDGQGVAFTTNRTALLEHATERFRSDDWDADPSRCCILCYTNREVDRINRRIRRKIVGSDHEYVEGEWLVARDSFAHEDRVLWYTSEAARVVSAQRYQSIFGNWEEWELTLEKTDGRTITVPALPQESYEEYRLEKQRRLQEAKESSSSERRRRWEKFYKLTGYYAAPRYPYSTTVHKAQGSDWDTVYIIQPDFNRCRNAHERHCMLYTACTRARERLAILV
jgi:exodeoxyribonuclease-5